MFGFGRKIQGSGDSKLGYAKAWPAYIQYVIHMFEFILFEVWLLGNFRSSISASSFRPVCILKFVPELFF